MVNFWCFEIFGKSIQFWRIFVQQKYVSLKAIGTCSFCGISTAFKEFIYWFCLLTKYIWNYLFLFSNFYFLNWVIFWCFESFEKIKYGEYICSKNVYIFLKNYRDLQLFRNFCSFEGIYFLFFGNKLFFDWFLQFCFFEFWAFGLIFQWCL